MKTWASNGASVFWFETWDLFNRLRHYCARPEFSPESSLFRLNPLSQMDEMRKLGMTGADLFCAVIARERSKRRHSIAISERCPHVGSNCHAECDADSSLMLHACCPHSFHTDDE